MAFDQNFGDKAIVLVVQNDAGIDVYEPLQAVTQNTIVSANSKLISFSL